MHIAPIVCTHCRHPLRTLHCCAASRASIVIDTISREAMKVRDATRTQQSSTSLSLSLSLSLSISLSSPSSSNSSSSVLCVMSLTPTHSLSGCVLWTDQHGEINADQRDASTEDPPFGCWAHYKLLLQSCGELKLCMWVSVRVVAYVLCFTVF